MRSAAENSLHMYSLRLLSYSLIWLWATSSVCCLCGFPGAPAHSTVEFSPADAAILATSVSAGAQVGTVARYSCDRGFELLGPARRICGVNGTWTPQGIPFCVLNVAAGKAPMQSSVSEGGIPQKAVDGSTSTFFDASTCSLTDVERSPWWYVNLLEPYMVQLVRIDFGQSCCAKDRTATIIVRVGNNRPDLGVNPICNRFTGSLEEGRPLFLPCNPPMPGAFVSVHFEGPPGVSLSICEAFVYTDQALPIERCPTFRDQPPGSTATYNGKCYIFYNQQPSTMQAAMDFCESRGGSLVDESNPALQGFLSWELWRRHKGDANGQYWLGAVRDRTDTKTWKWISGKPVSVSFWNLPGGNDNCARFDGTKGWLWSDTNCGLKLNYICQHRPTTCGKPEQPPNSTLIAKNNFGVGSRIEYICNEGHLLVGPAKRSCLPTGFYSEFPPVCRFLECGMPADVDNAQLVLVNSTRQFRSLVRYTCSPGFVTVGRAELMCDVDERWNGPPPRCEPVYCEEPPQIRHGGYSLSTNSTRFGTVAAYYCTSPRHKLVGNSKLRCQPDGSWDVQPPTCRLGDAKDIAKPTEAVPEEPKIRPRPGFPKVTSTSDRPLIKTAGDFPRLPPPSTSKEPLAPVANEIPDSANVQANPGQGANVPSSVENETVGESKQAQLNLGGIIALGVFGGFVFLAAIITTIVILIRRARNSRRFRNPSSSKTSGSRGSHSSSSGPKGSGSTGSSGSFKSTSTRSTADRAAVYRKEPMRASSSSSFRARLEPHEGDRDASEMIINSYTKPEKKHHHHHHHRHKHRRSDVASAEERH